MRKRGRNLAINYKSASRLLLQEAVSDEICFFISHKKEDKPSAIAISDYINHAGFNTYIDLHDEELQRAVDEMNSKTITECIEKGLVKSSHIICLISNATRKSWWVPFEIGYAKKAGARVLTLKLKGEFELPEYLKISKMILGTKGLNRYLEILLQKELLVEEVVKGGFTKIASMPRHPLDEHLDWNK
ncbi:MAG: toll/interleukin-1 receptor domain-containing protein [Fibrobacteres bacterium]|nr:toll/interleukin-1 receptor domain-containing protein [Fibrobacterota bacterium]